jgi:uncharacterized BrkB/YihY/UPF0761 family membrane protein
VLVVAKAALCATLIRGARDHPAVHVLFGLALTSLAATVVTVICYSWAPDTLAAIADALAAGTVALAALLWAGVGIGRALSQRA